jgi:hypothetical protein
MASAERENYLFKIRASSFGARQIVSRKGMDHSLTFAGRYWSEDRFQGTYSVKKGNYRDVPCANPPFCRSKRKIHRSSYFQHAAKEMDGIGIL